MSDNPIIYLDMDGVVADIKTGYYNAFDRNINEDDSFTVFQYISTIPYFFRTLPVLEQGRELYNRLIQKYEVIFLTNPAKQNPTCRADKVKWLKENFGEGLTVLFSGNKEDYAQSSFDILIDDMDRNLIPFAEAGGTAIDFRKYDNNKIMTLIAEVVNPQEEIRQVVEQIKKMKVETEPTEKQKESGIYKKGDIVIKGIRVKIENPKGSTRFGFDEKGAKWITRMKNHYGYIVHKGDAIDGDKIDCFIGDSFKNNKCYVINQGKGGLFDEHKVMLGFDSIEDAKESYLRNYQKGWSKNLLSIIPTNTKLLREWVNSGNLMEPYRGNNE